VGAGRKLALLTCLYFTQGLPFGFFTQALPVLLRKQGVSLPAIGATSLLALPWAIKFAWAPFVDRHGPVRFGRRRSWIVPLQALAVVTALVLAAFDPRSALPIVVAGLFLTNLIAATQDIATDALAVDLLAPEERGRGNGVQVAGYRAGMIVGGGALIVIAGRGGWQLALLIMGALLAIASFPIVLHRERPVAFEPTRARVTAILREAFARPGMASWILVLVAYKSGDAFATGMLRPFLVDIGLELEDIGWLLGTAGFIAGAVGALTGGWAAERFGRRRALLACGLAQALAVLMYVAPALGLRDTRLLYLLCSAEHFAGGTATAALFTLMMDASRPETAATDYTIQASIVVIATGTASALSGASAHAIGYAAHFGCSSLLCLAAIAFVARRLHGDQPLPDRV